jgi:hypothetical protein
MLVSSTSLGSAWRNVLLGTLCALVLSACYVYTRPVAVAPPAPQVASDPEPRPGFVWVRGYWSWNGNQYVWVRGRWVAERPGYHWVHAHWVQADGTWQFVAGHWEPNG